MFLERFSDPELEDFKVETYPRMEIAREDDGLLHDGLLHDRLTAIFGYGVKSPVEQPARS